MPRDITLTFSDGSAHVYKDAPDDITPDQVLARAKSDFPKQSITNLDGGRGGPAPAAATSPAPAPRTTEQLLDDIGPEPPLPPPPGLIDRAKAAASGLMDRFEKNKAEAATHQDDGADLLHQYVVDPAVDAVRRAAAAISSSDVNRTDVRPGTPPAPAATIRYTPRGPQVITPPAPPAPSNLDQAFGPDTPDMQIAPSVTPLEAAYGGTIAPGHEADALATVRRRQAAGRPAPAVPAGAEVRDNPDAEPTAPALQWAQPINLTTTDKLIDAAGGEKSAWGNGVRKTADTAISLARVVPETLKFGTEALELASAGYITSPTQFMEKWDEGLGAMSSSDTHAKQMQLDVMLHDPNVSAAQVSSFLTSNPLFATQTAIPSAGSMLVGAGSAKLGMKLALRAGIRQGLTGEALAQAADRGAEWGANIGNAAMNGADNFHETQGDAWHKFLSASIAAAGTLGVGQITEGGAAARIVKGGQKFTANPLANTAANLAASVGKEGVQEYGEQLSQDFGQNVAEGKPNDLNSMQKNATVAAIQGGLLGIAGGRGGDAKAVAHDAILASVDDVAAKHGLFPKAAAALRDAVVGMDPEDAIAFTTRALHGFEGQGMVKRAGSPTAFRTALADRLASTEPTDAQSAPAPSSASPSPASSAGTSAPAATGATADNPPASEVASPPGATAATFSGRDRGASGPVAASALLGAPTEDDTDQANAIAAAAHSTAATSPLNATPEPTSAQKEAGNYAMGHVKLHGLDITIENPQGSVRSGTSPDGSRWTNTLPAHYGYIRGTKASDGDHVDTFIGPSPSSQVAYVIDQVDPKTGKFDEPKTILGATSEQQARELYLAAHEDGWNGLGAITALPIDSFKAWVKDGVKSKPLGDISGWKADRDAEIDGHVTRLNQSIDNLRQLADTVSRGAAPSARSAPTPAPSAPSATIAGQAVDKISDDQLQRFAKSTSIAPAARDAAAAEVTRRAAPSAEQTPASAAPAQSAAPTVEGDQHGQEEGRRQEVLTAAPPAAPRGGAAARGQSNAKHPERVMSSRVLALISKNLGGLSPSMLSDLAPRIETTRKDKNGRPIVIQRNPPIPGVGLLFRNGGTSDFEEIGRVLQEHGYIPPGTADVGERAYDMVQRVLHGNGDPQTWEDEIASHEAARDAEAAHYHEIDAESQRELEAEREAILAAADMKPADLDSLDDDMLWDAKGVPHATNPFEGDDHAESGSTEADAAATRRAEEAAPPAAPAASQTAANREAAPQPAPLTAQTPADLEAKAARETAGKKADADEQKRLADKAKADAERGEFTLTGSDRSADVAAAGGQQDLLSAPPATAPTPDELRVLRDKVAGGNATPEERAKVAQANKDAAPSANTVFTDDAAAKARARLRSKLGRTNHIGLDPEDLVDAIILSGYHIEKGARKFAAYARAMLDDLGEKARPYLKSWYLATRYDPRAGDFAKDMSTAGFVDEFDLDALTAASEPAAEPAPAPAAPAPTLAAPPAPAARELVEHVTGKGKTITGYIQKGITKAQAQTVDAYTFPKDGGFFIREKHLAELDKAFPPAGAAPAAAAPEEHARPGGTPTAFADLVQHLKAEIAKPNGMPADNRALAKLVAAFDGRHPSPARMKVAQEALESAIVGRARYITHHAPIRGNRQTFDDLLSLYQSQPNLNVRTSTSIENQAYSTPAPLAYIADRLAGVNGTTSVLEPTAGTGMLLIAADPAKSIANELDDDRASALRADGFKVTQDDAATTDLAPAKSVDRVVTNPPFGPLKDEAGSNQTVSYDGFKLGQLDHLIAARALAAMKDDGRAVLILGANKVAGGMSKSDQTFFNWLYSHYDVAHHFEADGDLYARQGAGWPVRIITIRGRVASDRNSLAAKDITRAKTWSDVYDQYEQGLAAVQRAAESRGGAGSPVQRPGAADDAGAPAVSPRGEAAGGDRRQPEGGARGAADVAGRSPGAVGDRGAAPKPGVGVSAGQQRPGEQPGAAQPAGEREPAAARTARDSRPVGNPVLTDPENQFQAKYIARSDRKDEGVLIPVNMAQPTQAALDVLEDDVGNIDDFARAQLGYRDVAQMHAALMGLQVDSVASAIQQMGRGKGVIVADQTGIGKGRQAAAVIRWAIKQGHIPIFVTVKPSLFTDMFGDLHDIGSDNVRPLILNVGESIKAGDGSALFTNRPAQHRNTLEAIATTGKLPADRNALFMTYSQINVDNVQRRAVMALADRAVFVLDESHNAGGDSATGTFIKGTLDVAKGVTYLSATYAKRPDNMPVYFKTDIGDAIADDNALMSAMELGGLPLQTVVSHNLVKAGQMFRRERSYDGVSIVTKVDTARRAEHEKLSNAVTQALRAIVAADHEFHEGFVKREQVRLREAQKADVLMDTGGNQAKESVNHTEFSSVVHNFVRQMLLGLKAQTAAEDAIAALKAGEKPMIALENTMGSFLSEYAAANGLTPGMDLGDFTYRTVLGRALNRTRFLKRRLPNGEEVREEITLDKLDAEARAKYDAAQSVIDDLDIDLPVSPIDWMRQQITAAGYTVREITGRNLSVDYSTPGKPKLSQLEQSEQRDKVATTRAFNDGTLDALVLNVAGSTGISLHASEKFADKRQRHMIVAQPAQDINIFMQMLGRIHRTGQVVLPKYTILNVDLPAEKRPTALLAKKMKSLNANTSSNTESATSVQAADMLNKYGDRVVEQYLLDNPELAMALNLDVMGDDEDTSIDGPEDMARKATGRLALMPVDVQEQFYEDVEQQYATTIDYLNKTNQNELEPRTFDFDAKELASTVIHEGDNHASPFGQDASLVTYSVKAQGKPMTPAEIQGEINDGLGGKTPAAHTADLVAALSAMSDKNRAKLSPGSENDFDNTSRTGVAFIREHPIGSLWRVDINGDPYNAVVTHIRNLHKAGAGGNPFALSKIQLTIAVNGALRSLTVPATQFQKITTASLQAGYRLEQLFGQARNDDRQQVRIIVGNLLGAYGEITGTRGTIVTFTKEDGTTEQGILMPKSFNPVQNVRRDYRMRTGEDAWTVLQNATTKDFKKLGLATRDQVVRVTPEDDGITITVPKSKAKGGKYFLDPVLREATGDFVSAGGMMRATVDGRAAAVKALNVLMKKGALYANESTAAEARGLVGDKDDGGPPTPGGGIALTSQSAPFWSPLERAVRDAKMNAAPAGAWQQFLKGLVSKGVKPDEIAWSGIEDWLKLQDGKVSRDAVLTYLREGGVRVTESMHSNVSDHEADVNKALAGTGYTVDADYDGEALMFTDPDGEEVEYDDLPEDVRATVDKMGMTGPTKFDQYTLPGGKNYRELLLTLPTTYDSARLHELEIRMNSLDRGTHEEREEHRLLAARAASEATFKSGHWDEPNILAHIRFNERTDSNGKRVLFVEEIQSDWGASNRRALDKITKPQSVRELADNLFGREVASLMPLDQMDGGVLSALKHNQVRRAVIARLPINMVHDLVGEKGSPEQIFSNTNVLVSRLAADHRGPVLDALLGATRSVGAELRTKLLLARKTGGDAELLPALKASDLDAREVVGLLSPDRIYHDGLSGDAGGREVAGSVAIGQSRAADGARRTPEEGPAVRAGDRGNRIGASVGAEAAPLGMAGANTENSQASLAGLLDWHARILGKTGDSQQGYLSGPFVGRTEAYVSLALKRTVKYAVDGGFDRVAFVNGEQSAARYDLSKQIDSIEVSRRVNAVDLLEGKEVVLHLPNFGGEITFGVGDDGLVDNVRRAMGLDIKVGTPLEDIIGKELAERVMEPQGLGVRTLEGEGLKIGGEGMKAFYDKIVPTVAKDVVRKLGGDGMVRIAIPKPGYDYTVRQYGDRFEVLHDNEEMLNEVVATFDNWSEAERYAGRENERVGGTATNQIGFDITDAMRTEAGDGLPLFRAGEAPAERVTAAALRDDVARLTAQWDNAPEITVVESAFDLPPDIRRQLVDMRAANKTRALIMPDTGDVYLIAQANPTLDDARFALMHEVLGHYGIRGFLGDEDTYFRTMYQLRQANPELTREADDWLRQHGQGAVEGRIKRGMSPSDAMREVRALATEEALADRAGRNAPIKAWQKVVAKVQAFLRSIGWDGLADRLERMTEAETADLLTRARWHVTGSTQPHVFTGAAMPLTSQASPAAAAPTPAEPTLKPSSAPLDTAMRVAFTPVQFVTSRAGAWAAHAIDSTLTHLPGDLGRFYVSSKAGIVSDFGLSSDYKDARSLMETAIRKGTREAATVVDQLHGLSTDEARVAYLWMTEKPDTATEQALLLELPPESRQILADLKARIDSLGAAAVELGLISPEVYERNQMAYLHRSYQKYALGGDKGSQASAAVARSRAVKILGDQFKGRGLRDDVPDSKVADPDWWQRRRRAVQADTSLKGAKFYRLELRALPDTATGDMVGAVERKLGKLRQVVYWPEGDPIPRHLADWRNDGLWEARFFDKGGKVGMWRDFTLDERTAMGEIQEVRYAAANTILSANRDVEVARMLKWVATNISELTPDQMPAGTSVAEAHGDGIGLIVPYRPDQWVQVPDVSIPGTGLKRWGALAGRYVPGPVWNDLRQVSSLAGGNEWTGAFTKAMNAWKVSKTALSPTTHMNNVMANFVLADAHDIQARHILGAVKAWLGVRKGRAVKDPEAQALIHAYQDNGGDGGKFTEGELRHEIAAKLIAQLEQDIGKGDPSSALISAAQVIDLLKHGEIRQALATIGHTKTIGLSKKAVGVMVKAYGHEDEIFRLAAYIKAKADGLSDHDAGKFARESFVDYRINAPWIQAMRRTAWPFISFSYRVIPMMTSIALNKPHKLAKWMLVAGGLNKLAYMMVAAGAGGGGLPPDELERRERAFLPDEKIGNELGVFPKLLRMPWDEALFDKEGKHVGDAPEFLDLRRWIPGGDFADTTGDQTPVPVLSNLMPGGPLALMDEVLSNRDWFTGKDISEKTDYLSEKSAKLAAFLWKGVIPNFPGIPGAYSTDKIMAAATPGRTDSLGREYSGVDAGLSAIGVKVAAYPRDSLQQAAKDDARSRIDQIQRDLKAQGRMLQPKGISQADFDKAIAVAQEKIKAISDKLVKQIATANGTETATP